MISYTAKYTKIASGYMGQLVEWPEVITEGKERFLPAQGRRQSFHLHERQKGNSGKKAQTTRSNHSQRTLQTGRTRSKVLTSFSQTPTKSDFYSLYEQIELSGQGLGPRQVIDIA